MFEFDNLSWNTWLIFPQVCQWHIARGSSPWWYFRLTINFRDFLSYWRDGWKKEGGGGEKDAFRQETFIKYRSKEETEEDALAFSQSRAGSHQRLRTASKVQDAFLRQAIPPVRREGWSHHRRKSLHLRFLFYWCNGTHHDERILHSLSFWEECSLPSTKIVVSIFIGQKFIHRFPE